MTIKMIQDLRNRIESWMEKIQEMFNVDLEELKNKITVMNSRITEMKNTLEENFPNMGNEIITHVQGSQRVPYKINPRRNMLRHINQTNKS